MATQEELSVKTDEELVGLVLENQDYFSHLLNRYEGKLLSYILRISNIRTEEAEDVLQEVFIKVYRNLNDFDQGLKFSSWIYRIAHNQVISNFRRTKARPQEIIFDINEHSLDKLASNMDLMQEIDIKYLRKNIYKILKTIDIKYREVLVLKFLEEKNYAEISDIIKKPMGTVATLINRAKKEFRRELERQNIKLK